MTSKDYKLRLLEAKVKAVNAANAAALLFYQQNVPIFAQFLGKDIIKVGGELKVNVHKKLLGLQLTPTISILHSPGYSILSFVVKVSQQVEDEHSCLYHETSICFGSLNRGILMNLRPEPELPTNWTPEKVQKQRDAIDSLQQALNEARSNLFPFKMYDD